MADTDGEEIYSFRLFAAPPTTTAGAAPLPTAGAPTTITSASTPAPATTAEPKIRLSATPPFDADVKAASSVAPAPRRPQGYYTAAPASGSLRKRLEASAVSSEMVREWAKRPCPGLKYSWRLSSATMAGCWVEASSFSSSSPSSSSTATRTATNSITTTTTPGHAAASAETEVPGSESVKAKKKRTRKSKGTRIKIRIKFATEERTRLEKAKEAAERREREDRDRRAREAHMAEKKRAVNRRKQIRKREKMRAEGGSA